MGSNVRIGTFAVFCVGSILFFSLFVSLLPIFRIVVASPTTNQTSKISAELLNVSLARVIIQYENFSFGFATLTNPQILETSRRADVQKIYPDNQVSVCLNDSVPIIKDSTAWKKTEENYGYNINGTGIKIAILDTGIDKTHPDLNDLDDNPATNDPKVILEKDFTGCGHVYDDYGHGTHCASIAAGTGEASNYTYVGVAPGAWLLNGKVLDANGNGQWSWIIAGIKWAVQNGANVVSLSLGGFGSPDDPVSQMVDWAVGQGVVVVVAAGNNGALGVGSVLSPGLARKALTVGATCKNGSLAGFSSYGPTNDYRLKPEVLAVGVNVVAARANGTKKGTIINNYYTMMSGTSMATPHIAGAVALIKQVHPSWTPEQVKAVLVETATPLNCSEYMVGGGIINVCNATTTQAFLTPAPLNFGVGETLSLNATTTAFTPQTFTFTDNIVSATPNPATGNTTVKFIIKNQLEGVVFGTVYVTSNVTVLRLPYFAVINKNWPNPLRFATRILTGVECANSFALDGDILYVAHDTNPARIDKINLTSYKVLATLKLTQNRAYSLITKNGFLYVGTFTVPAHILKIALTNFTIVADLTFTRCDANNLRSLVICSNYLFASFNTNPAVVAQINLTTFTTTKIMYYGDASPLAIGSLTLATRDGRLYAGSWGLWGYGSVVPPKTGRVCEIDITTLKITRSTTLAENEQYIKDLEFKNDTLVIAVYGPNILQPSRVVTINLTSFVETQHTVLSPTDLFLYDLTITNDKVYGVSPATGIIVLNCTLQKVGAFNINETAFTITNYNGTLIVGTAGGNIYFVSTTSGNKMLTVSATEEGTTDPTVGNGSGFSLLSSLRLSFKKTGETAF